MTDRHRRSMRRAAIRRHHPDAGGSADALIAALAALDGPSLATLSVTSTRLVRLRRLRRTLTRRLRRTTYITLYDNTFHDTGGLT